MISMEQISGEIAALQEEKPTHVTMQKLAALYTVRDHMVIDAQPVIPAVAVAEIVPEFGESEFAKLIHGKDQTKIWSIMDELMQTLQVINPQLYAGVIRRLEE